MIKNLLPSRCFGCPLSLAFSGHEFSTSVLSELAYCGPELAFFAHDKICEGTATEADIHAKADKDFDQLSADCENDNELIAIHIYQLFTSKSHQSPSLLNTWLPLSTPK